MKSSINLFTKILISLLLVFVPFLSFIPITHAVTMKASLVHAPEDRLSIIDLSKPAFFTLRDIMWEPAPTTLPGGAMIAILEGDPNQGGPFTLRLKLPENYEIPAHWSAMDEHISVITGNLFLGMGDKLDRNKGITFPAGSFARIPPKIHHYFWTSEETIIQLHGIGPWIMGYVTAKSTEQESKQAPQNQDPSKMPIVTTPPNEMIHVVPGITELGPRSNNVHGTQKTSEILEGKRYQNSANDASLPEMRFNQEEDLDLVEELRKKGRLR